MTDLKNIIVKITTMSMVSTLAVCLVAGSVPALFAAVMSSSNYSLQSDSVNFGGALSQSASYTIEDTVGEIATGESSSSSYKLKAGYQQMQEVYLAISSASDVTMSPELDGTAGGTSNGSTEVTVTTDNLTGYTLSIKASSSPAMQGEATSATISNYTPTGSDPDFTFSVASTDGEFGFTPEGTDITSKYKDNGSSCNTGSGSTADACWNPVTTTNETIASRTIGNHPNGITTTIKFRITLGSALTQTADTYTATSTLTAVSQ